MLYQTKYQAFIKCVLFYLIPYTTNAQVQSHQILEIGSWQFKQQNNEPWMPAHVPGNVHTDLFQAGIISSLYNSGDDIKNYWIETKNWEYQSVFEVSNKLLQQTHIDLHCKGLDTYAKIFINDIEVATSSNMFLPCITNIKNFVKPGSNTIRILFESPVTKVKSNAIKYGKLPMDNDTSATQVFTRKAAYHYGWDFTPRMVTMGIWQPVFIDAWTSVNINEVALKTLKINSKRARLEATIVMEAPCDEWVQIIIKDYNNQEIEVSKMMVKSSGNDVVKVPVIIENPVLWQTNGLGKQKCYNVDVEVIANNEVAKKSIRTGIREVEVINQSDKAGKNFYIKLNDKPVYIFGANYTPLSVFNGTVTKADYDKLFAALKQSGVNMLRIWGGGIYEDDYFYQLADENGILIWQDFMFAGAMYPADSAFIQSVTDEATYQIKRLRNNASTALWCGNNEIDVAWKNWGWQKTYQINEVLQKKLTNDYTIVFEKLLPSLVQKFDSGRFYMHSSPQSNWGKKTDFNFGNSHLWGVWHGDKPVNSYFDDVPRFATEFGMPSLPGISTLNNYVKAESIDDIQVSQMMRSYKGVSALKKYTLSGYTEPNSLANWVYTTQCMQAEAVLKAINAQRMKKPFCMGSMYWQIADCWPGITWAAIDFDKNYKALQYKLPQAFSTYAIAAQCSEEKICVSLINDGPKNKSATVELYIKNFNGAVLWQHTLHVKLKTDINVTLTLDSILPKIKQWGQGNVYLLGLMYDAAGLLANQHYFFDETKKLQIPEPTIAADVCAYGNDYLLTINSKYLVKDVFCNVYNAKADFSNNYFDLLPNESQQVIIKTTLPINQLIESISLKTSNGMVTINHSTN
ncbi:MAG: hypothetical protein JNK61_07275 [Bacteroidia bacterium]|nr:hypothetical protein [Bacteroidia bacterium]